VRSSAGGIIHLPEEIIKVSMEIATWVVAILLCLCLKPNGKDLTLTWMELPSVFVCSTMAWQRDVTGPGLHQVTRTGPVEQLGCSFAFSVF